MKIKAQSKLSTVYSCANDRFLQSFMKSSALAQNQRIINNRPWMKNFRLSTIFDNYLPLFAILETTETKTNDFNITY